MRHFKSPAMTQCEGAALTERAEGHVHAAWACWLAVWTRAIKASSRVGSGSAGVATRARRLAGVPVAIVRGLDRSWFRESGVAELVRAPAEDLFR